MSAQFDEHSPDGSDLEPERQAPPPGPPRLALGRKVFENQSLRRVLVNLFLLTVGSAVYAVGVKAILIPQQFLSGGVLGVTLIIHYLSPTLNLSLIYVALNLPLFWLGWFQIGRRFMLYTAFGVGVFSLAVEVIAVEPFPLTNPILAAVLAGLICGLGAGIILRSAGSGGGTDILGVYLNKRFSLRLGWTSFVVNGLILSAAAFLFGLEMALYTMIFVFTQGKLIDAVVTGFNQRKSIIVISDRSVEIAEAILNRLGRGVTFLDGQGAYTGQAKKVVFSIVTLAELARVKELVYGLDASAFVVINDTLEVLGKRHGQRRVY